MSTATPLPTRAEIEARPPRRQELGQITAAMIRRYATVVGETNPLYFDDAVARAHGHRGIVAPPTYLAAVLGWKDGPREEELMEDGSDPALVLPETAGRRFMGGGQSIESFEPVCAGDSITAWTRLLDAYEKEAGSGRLVFMVSETVHENQLGQRVLRCRETLIASSP